MFPAEFRAFTSSVRLRMYWIFSWLASVIIAVMIELIQGEGGVFVLPQDYVRELRKLCDENDILLLIDEVQTGIGRTGALFAYQKYGIKPDICSFAKGILP